METKKIKNKKENLQEIPEGSKQRPLGIVWTVPIALTSRLPVSSHWLWPWIPCWSFIFPLPSWTLGLCLIPTSAIGNVAWVFVPRQLQNSEKSENNASYSVWLSHEQLNSHWVADLCCILSRGSMMWWVLTQPGSGFLLHCWLDFPNQTPAFLDVGREWVKMISTECLPQSWFRGVLMVTLMKIKLQGLSYVAAPCKALGGCLASLICNFGLCFLKGFKY